jgi:hypothetical protein
MRTTEDNRAGAKVLRRLQATGFRLHSDAPPATGMAATAGSPLKPVA